jgi:hypothetical protein
MAAANKFRPVVKILNVAKKVDEVPSSYNRAINRGTFMALSGADFGAPQFYRSSAAQVLQQKTLLQQSKELSDAVGALQAPTVSVSPARGGTGASMATLCLVQPGDSGYSSGSLGSALAAYATVLSD